MLNERVLYSLDDVTIIPAVCTDVDHRAECNPYVDHNGKQVLPIFTAPMFSVVGVDSLKQYENNNIIPILPRLKSIVMTLDERVNKSAEMWVAFGLDEFISVFANEDDVISGVHYVLIDIANGHMRKMMGAITIAKDLNKDIVIMAGNVAHPMTYAMLSEIGVDYVRICVGTGKSCTTASNLGLFYPSYSLINDCWKLKQTQKLSAKIVADGGIRGSRYIFKALAAGADYVMCGGIFAKCLEAEGAIRIDDEYYDGHIKTDTQLFKEQFVKQHKITREYYGMSTKRAQSEMGNEKLHTGEGRCVTIQVTNTLKDLMENYTDWMRSVMSYCNIKDIKDFNPNNVTMHLVSNSSIGSYND